MKLIISLLFSLSSATSLISVCVYCKTRMTPKWLLLILPVASAFVFAFTYSVHKDLNLVAGALFYAASFVCEALVNSREKKTALYLTALCVSLSSLIQTASLWMLRLSDEYAVTWISLIISHMIFSAVLIILRRVLDKKVKLVKIKLVPDLIYLLVLLCVFLAGGIFPSFIYNNDGSRAVSQVVFALLLLVMITICAFLVVFTMKHRYSQYMEKLLSERMDEQVRFYRSRIETDSKIRRFRHDYKNHLFCIKSLVQAKQYDEATEYINEITSDDGSSAMKIDSGNYLADAILCDKAEKAKANQIEFAFSGLIPATGIANSDLCTILANALDNAVEACLNSSPELKRRIAVDCKSVKNCFFLSIENTSEKVNFPLKTTKTDGSNHGFGMLSMEKTVAKYKGILETAYSDNVFKLSIQMNITRPDF